MIQHLSREQLDVEKYDLCIEKAQNSRIYAYSWYLDCVADNWSVLVKNDYEMVMPLPFRRKYFIKYTYPPCWTQQLGIFSSEMLTESFIMEFVDKLPKQYKKHTIYLNSGNELKLFKPRQNFILKLSKQYDTLQFNYNKTRKRIITNNNRNIVIEKATNYSDFINFYKQFTAKKVGFNDEDFQKLERLVEVLSAKEKIRLYVATKSKQLIAGAIFLVDTNRITYLMSSANEIGKQENAMSFIIDTAIKRCANSEMVLDFEGSMVKGIAFFFKSFGAKNEPYYVFEKSLSLL